MGRAQGRGGAVATDAFAELMGTRRGGNRPVATPAAAQAAAEQLVREMHRSGNPTAVIAELQQQVPLPRTPAVQTLLAGLIEVVAAPLIWGWGHTVSDVADVAGIRSSSEAETLVSRRLRRMVHVWPDGETTADRLYGSGTTLCGVRFDLGWKEDWGRAQRGAFTETHPGGHMQVCSRCRKLVARQPELYPEATEKYNEKAVLWPAAAAAFNTQVQERLGETFTQAFDTTQVDELALRDRAQAGVRATYLDVLVAEAGRKAERVITNTCSTSYGYDLAQMLGRERTFDGSLQREVASWIDAASWRALLETAMPAAPELQLGGIGERYRRNLSARISELAGR